MRSIFVVLLLIFLLSGCSKPLPQDKLAYAGEWQSEEMYLLITTDSMVQYHRQSGNRSTSIDAPLKEFTGDDFIVGFSVFTTTFDVTQPPQLIDGQWIMVVDGITLIKTADVR